MVHVPAFSMKSVDSTEQATHLSQLRYFLGEDCRSGSGPPRNLYAGLSTPVSARRNRFMIGARFDAEWAARATPSHASRFPDRHDTASDDAVAIIMALRAPDSTW